MERRTLLAGVAAGLGAGLAGCLDAPGTDESAAYHLEVTVQNDHDRPYDASVVLTDADGNRVLDDSFTVGPGEGRGLGDDYPAGTYTLEVELADRGRLRSFWDTDQCDVLQARTTVEPDGRLTNAVRCADRTTTTTR